MCVCGRGGGGGGGGGDLQKYETVLHHFKNYRSPSIVTFQEKNRFHDNDQGTFLEGLKFL